MSGHAGNPLHWAPEIFEIIYYSSAELHQTIVTTKSDIFAFAYVLFTFFTKGIHPFGSNNKEIMENIMSKKIPTNLNGMKQFQLLLAKNCSIIIYLFIII